MSLVIERATYRYAGAPAPALHEVSLELQPGEVLGLTGANESGKSTLCLVAAGLAPATIGGRLTGRVLLDELDAAASPPHALAGRCGVLFQNPVTQLSGTTSTVWEEVAFGPRNLGLSLADVAERVEEALGLLGIVELASRDPQRLSGGQGQLVALAAVLALRPPYLVLDEPTSQLDPQGTRMVGEAIAALARHTGAGILLAEHKTDLLDAVAGRVVVLRDGRVAAEGRAAEVLADPSLDAHGVSVPARVRLARAADRAGVRMPEPA